MMAVTHAMIAAAGCSLILGTANPMTLGLAVVGSQLPDAAYPEANPERIASISEKSKRSITVPQPQF